MFSETVISPELQLSPPLVYNDCSRQRSRKRKKRFHVEELSDDDSLEGCRSQKPKIVYVMRPIEVEESREDLPIIMMEQEIMEAINEHPIVIICGETGCGKTTQVPQFLFEAGYGSKKYVDRRGAIGVTQPRRIAARTTAKRVAYELGLSLGKEVGFQVRHDKIIGKNSAIKFMTDGILLREVQNDLLLRLYSVIILDEVHERSVNSDILIGMLTTVMRLRQRTYKKQQKIIRSGQTISPENMIFPLKVVLMSATMRVRDFISLFSRRPPVIKVSTRQFPVTIYFSKRTELVDYIGQAFRKVLSIHKRLPYGGILVFVTGQREVNDLCRKLRNASKQMSAQWNASKRIHVASKTNSNEEMKIQDTNQAFNSSDNLTDRFSCHFEDVSSYNDDQSDGSNDSETTTEIVPENCCPLHVLPLYGKLPAAKQIHVFEKVKEGQRLVVVATNVAETSLTIPGIKYVVDTGREKVKNYDLSSDVGVHGIQWISKASAAQRAGRAGRTGPGHCYRLYSSACFNNEFPDFSRAKISEVPLDDIVLFLESMNCKVEKFRFPTPPEATALNEAKKCLKNLKALDKNGKLTPLGKAMAYYPINPRHSRMLLTVIQIMKTKYCARPNLVIGYAVAAAAALSSSSPFLMQFDGCNDNRNDLEQNKSRENKLKEAAKLSCVEFSNPSSDALTIAYALHCFELSNRSEDFCSENRLHYDTMKEMSKQREQLLHIAFKQSVNHGSEHEFSWTYGTIDDAVKAWKVSSGKNRLLLNEEDILREAICAGWVDRAAKRIRGGSRSSEGDGEVHLVSYQSCMANGDVFLHRQSSLSGSAPEFLVYTELFHSKRPYIRGATSVKSEWLVKYAIEPLCKISASVTDSNPLFYDPKTDQVYCQVVYTFGLHMWQFPGTKAVTSLQDRIKIFACALLEGKVLPCLRESKSFLAAAPSKVLNREGERRVGNLLDKLRKNSIDSCAMLRKVWKENPEELHSEMLDWFKKSFHNEFAELWLKMHLEVQQFPSLVRRK